MRTNNFIYKVNGQEYQVFITYKRVKNITFTYKSDGFHISCPTFTLKTQIIKGLDKYASQMILKAEKNKKILPFTDEHVYIFGRKVNISLSGGEINFSNGEQIKYLSKIDLEKKLKKFFLPLITQRVRYWEQQMCLPSYKVRVQKMTSRLGSNSRRTNTLNFAFNLIHFRFEVIDTVVIHELAHIVHFDHSKNFYNVVYKYCPNYKKLQKTIKEGRYDD